MYFIWPILLFLVVVIIVVIVVVNLYLVGLFNVMGFELRDLEITNHEFGYWKPKFQWGPIVGTQCLVFTI